MLAVLVLVPVATGRLARPPVGAWLTDHELTNINSVDCLKRRHSGQRGGDCGGDPYKGDPGSWRIGHFPRYNESICGQKRNETAIADVWHNTEEDFQPFCDPDGLLSDAERTEITRELFRSWSSTRVPCGVPGAGRPDEPVPFRLGVAVLRTLPIAEQDEESLEMFGTSVMDIWDMGAHDGGLEGKRDGIANICPDSALLVFVQEPYQRFVVVAPNCDVICMDRNGQSVATAARVGWERNLRSAVLKSIHETERVVSRPTPSGTRPFSQDGRGAFFSRWLHSEDVMVETQRGLLVCFLTAAVLFFLALLRYALNKVIQRTVWDLQKEMEPGYVDDSLRREGAYRTGVAHFGRAV